MSDTSPRIQIQEKTSWKKFPDVEREKIISLAEETLWTPQGAEALNYLKNQRGISDSVIKQFHTGYCPANINHELAGRIIMPLYDAHNRPIAITSRDWKAPPEYMHWHEKFEKGKYLYGLDAAKDHIRRHGKAIVVEGQFDTTCLHSYGFNMTVAVLGCNLSIMHVIQLSRYCSEIYLLMDGDKAGKAAVSQAREVHSDYCLSNYHITFIPTALPEDIDPDDYVRQNGGVKMLINLLRTSKERLHV